MRLRWAQVYVSAAIVLAGIIAVVPRASALKAAGTHVTGVTINGSRVGPAFQGVGAISGGGGNSRLLIDYPPAQRQQVLNYLFKPSYGADLQILKLEIGGDAYATDGSEVSIEQTKGHINCHAGYEFWLAKQAQAVNPDVQLYGLQWNAPAWVGGGGEIGWTSDDIRYILDWMNCAKNTYGLKVAYLGGWNEHLPHGITPAIMQWFINLRKALNRAGYQSTKIVAVDSFAKVNKPGDIADFLARHPAFRRAIGVLGYHNLCRYPATGKLCSVPRAARRSGKPIWESEIGALRETTGIPAMARSIDNAYIQVAATGMIEWPLMSSMSAYLPEEDRGLVYAPQPWSGSYQVKEMAWVLAQTSQFTEPGWRHVNGASGQLGGAFGSYTTYESPSHKDWTLVAQTTEAPRAQTLTVHVDSGLPATSVHVWSTNLNSTHSGSWMFRRGTVKLSRGNFSYTMRPGFIYTFTTSGAGGKGHPTIPAAKTMALPYTATADASEEPNDLSPEDGSFEYKPGTAQGATGTFTQTTVHRPVFWQNPVNTRFPYAVVGGNTWKDYTVKANITFTGVNQSAGVISRFNHPKADGVAQRFYAYQFTLTQKGAWKLIRNMSGGKAHLMASGTLKSGAVGTGHPVTLALTAKGTRLTAVINGKTVRSVTDKHYRSGDAGISTGGWYPVHFNSLTVTR